MTLLLLLGQGTGEPPVPVGEVLSPTAFVGATGGTVGTARTPNPYAASTWGQARSTDPWVGGTETGLPTFVGAGDGAARASNGVLAVPYPSGILADDYLLLHVSFNHGSAPISFAGWEVLSGPVAHQAGSPRDWLLAQVAVGTESGTYANSNSVTSSFVRFARIYAFRGVDVADTPYESITASGPNASTTITDLGVTTTGPNRLAANFVSLADDVPIGPFTGQTGGTWYEPVGESLTSLDIGMTLQLQLADMESAGTIDGGSTTIGSSEKHLRFALALVGAAAAPPGFDDAFAYYTGGEFMHADEPVVLFLTET